MAKEEEWLLIHEDETQSPGEHLATVYGRSPDVPLSLQALTSLYSLNDDDPDTLVATEWGRD